jgi:Holliday junction resolvasome RuvABC endonuclease subunit
VPPTSLKKYVTGKGQGVPKSQMLLHVYKKWNVDITDDNAADSYALARLVSGTHTLAYEKEIYDKLQDPKFREK